MTQQVLDFLNSRDNFQGAAEVTTYEVYVHSRSLTVEVYDRGEDAGNHRYEVAAFWSDTADEERNTASDSYTLGNPEATLAMALHGPHWHKFRPSD